MAGTAGSPESRYESPPDFQDQGSVIELVSKLSRDQIIPLDLMRLALNESSSNIQISSQVKPQEIIDLFEAVGTKKQINPDEYPVSIRNFEIDDGTEVPVVFIQIPDCPDLPILFKAPDSEEEVKAGQQLWLALLEHWGVAASEDVRNIRGKFGLPEPAEKETQAAADQTPTIPDTPANVTPTPIEASNKPDLWKKLTASWLKKLGDNHIFLLELESEKLVRPQAVKKALIELGKQMEQDPTSELVVVYSPIYECNILAVRSRQESVDKPEMPDYEDTYILRLDRPSEVLAQALEFVELAGIFPQAKEGEESLRNKIFSEFSSTFEQRKAAASLPSLGYELKDICPTQEFRVSSERQISHINYLSDRIKLAGASSINIEVDDDGVGWVTLEIPTRDQANPWYREEILSLERLEAVGARGGSIAEARVKILDYYLRSGIITGKQRESIDEYMKGVMMKTYKDEYESDFASEFIEVEGGYNFRSLPKMNLDVFLFEIPNQFRSVENSVYTEFVRLIFKDNREKLRLIELFNYATNTLAKKMNERFVHPRLVRINDTMLAVVVRKNGITEGDNKRIDAGGYDETSDEILRSIIRSMVETANLPSMRE